jgi:C-terminal peptidase prc
MEERIAAGLSDGEFYALLSELISALNDDHSSFLSPEEARSEDDEYASAGTYTGVGLVTDVNTTTRHIYVLSVLPDSPAERAGIQPHDHILEIAGEPSVDEDGNSMSQLLRGEKGTSVAVLVRTPGQEPRPVQLTRDVVSSTERITGNILPGEVRIGYLNVPSLFERDVIARSRQTLRDLMKDGPLDGLILDLRTNGGGSFPNLRDLLGLFTSGTLGHLVDRAGAKSAVRARANGIGNSQTVPLVVLIGPATESFAEVLAGALQAKGRARLIGQNSAGNIETLLAHEFEDGSRLWLAEEGFRLPDGGSWELVGLAPNVRVDRNWDEYTAANDPVIAEAVRLLQ